MIKIQHFVVKAKIFINAVNIICQSVLIRFLGSQYAIKTAIYQILLSLKQFQLQHCQEESRRNLPSLIWLL